MPESGKSDDIKKGLDQTMKMPFEPADVELTQRINVDREAVIGKEEKENLISEIIEKQNESEVNTSASLTGKSVFTKKRITDDYVKSSTLVSAIDSIPPLEDELKLQDVNYNYDLKDKFSEGAQGIIRTAYDKSLKRDIVVKSLKVDEEEHRRQDADLFVSEARIMAQLDHPSIIPLYGLHCGAESKLHLAMKHIHGKTLQKYLKDIILLYKREGAANFDEKRSISTRIEYVIKVCEAVDYAHSKGVIHRDLKPENIMIGNYGEVYVMDWGLACLLKPEKETSAKDAKGKSELVGTPCYIAPELIKGSSYSPQSDIFSLGMILFEIITLNRAVGGKTINEVLKNIIKKNYAPFKHRFLKGKLSNDLKAIFEKAVCPVPSQRYKSAHDMAEDLKLYLMREETAARPDNIFRKCTRAMINHKLITSLVILCILLCLSASTIYSLSEQNALIKEQKIREAMLASFQSKFAKRAHKMEQIFFYFKTQLANLSHRAEQLLSKAAVPSEPIYSFANFAEPSTVPADFTYSAFYSIKLSLDNAIFIPGPGVKLTDKDSRRIFPMQEMFKHYMFTSNPRFRTMTPDAVRKEILTKGAPLSWASLGLKNGTMFSYPGTNNYSKNFDPRKRPWYKNALPHKDEVIWSEPYKCAVSGKMLIPCITCVYNDKKQFQGVASIDIRLDYLKESVFSNKELSCLKEYLLDENGNVLLSSDFEDKEAVIDEQEKTLIKESFPFNDELRQAIERGRVQFEVSRNKTKYIFALYKFPIGYYYIQQVSEKGLRQVWGKNSYHKNKSLLQHKY